MSKARQFRADGFLDQAIREYFYVLEQDSHNVGLLNDLGVALGIQTDHELALVFFKEALEVDPTHKLALQNKAAAEAALMQSADK